MPTTIHIPAALLKRVDRRASELEPSRGHYIVQVLEEALRARTEWSRRFLAALEEAGADREAGRAVDEMTRAIRAGRSRRKPPRL